MFIKFKLFLLTIDISAIIKLLLHYFKIIIYIEKRNIYYFFNY